MEGEGEVKKEEDNKDEAKKEEVVKEENKEEEKIVFHKPKTDFEDIRLLDVKLEGDQMEKFLSDTVRNAFKKCSSEKEIASYIKEEFEKNTNERWNCIVGTIKN